MTSTSTSTSTSTNPPSVDPEGRAADRPRLELTSSIQADTAMITIVGDVDHCTSVKLRGVQRCVLALGARSAVLDCSGVAYMDSGGINSILELHRYTAARGGTLTIQGPSADMRRLLAVTGIEALVTIT